MVILSWVRLALGIIFLLIGMFLFGIQILALFKFRYVLDRMQAAAMGDTLGIGSSLLGLMLLSGWNLTSKAGAGGDLFMVFLTGIVSSDCQTGGGDQSKAGAEVRGPR